MGCALSVPGFSLPLQMSLSATLQRTAYLLWNPLQQTFADLDLKSPIHPRPKVQLLQIATESAWKYSKCVKDMVLTLDSCAKLSEWRPKVNKLAKEDTDNR